MSGIFDDRDLVAARLGELAARVDEQRRAIDRLERLVLRLVERAPRPPARGRLPVFRVSRRALRVGSKVQSARAHCRENGISYFTFRSRLRMGWSVVDALTTRPGEPPRSRVERRTAPATLRRVGASR